MNNDQYNKPPKRFKYMLPVIVIIPVIAALLSLVVMLLWNATLPSLFNVGVINFWQAAGLLVLCKILFGGFGPFGRNGRGGGGPAMRNKFMNMTVEERQQMKEQWQRRCQQRKQNKD